MPPARQSGKSSSWRGARRAAQKAHVAHKWEGGTANLGSEQTRASSGRVGRRVASLTLLALFALGWFVWSILFAPQQTPLVLITMNTPHPDLPPNAWVQEDFERLQLLGGETLQVIDTSPEWHSSVDGLHDLEIRLKQTARDARHRSTVVIYVSMHGAVRDDGVPCLLAVAPGVSPLDTSTWVPVSELLAIVDRAEFSDDVCKLLVLDCGRMRVNWSAGVLYNTFADRLAETVRHADVRNLVVFNATSPGERAWESEDLRGSVFGWFFQRGIAGAADDVSEGGNGDRRVSLSELVAYVNLHVDSWVRFNRGERQRPMLLPRNPEDVEVAWALRRPARTQLARAAQEIGASQAPDQGELLELWRRYDKLRTPGIVTAQPLQVARLQRSLLQLEQAMSAGEAYAPVVTAARADVVLQLSLLEGGSFADGRAAGLGAVRFQESRSLAMAEAYESSSASASRALALLESIAGDETSMPADGGLDTLGSDVLRFTEVHFLRLLQQRYGIHDPPTVRDAIQTRLLAERAAVPSDERVFAGGPDSDSGQSSPWAAVERADALRLAREDELFAGHPVASSAWDQVNAAYEPVVQANRDRSATFAARDQILAELPYLGQWLCRVSGGVEQVAEADAAVAETLNDIISRIYHAPHDDMLVNVTAEQLASEIGALQSSFDGEYRRVLQPEGPAEGQQVRDGLALLAIPLMPAERDPDGRTPAEQRMALHSRVRAMASQRNSEWDFDRTSAEPPDAANHIPYLQRIETEWGRHPLERILADEETQPAEGDLLARHARREQFVRRRLTSMMHALETNSAATHEQPAAAEVRERRTRRDLSQAEHVARILAPLSADRPDSDPVLELRKWDLGRLMLWQAQRALTDCYGPAKDGEPPFAVEAAGAYLASAGDLTEERSLGGDDREDLQARLQDVAVAVDRGIVPAATDVVVIDGHGETTVIVRRGAAADAFPDGSRAAVFLGKPDAAGGSAPTVPLPPPADNESPLHLSLNPTTGVDSETCRVMFRGHQFAAPFQVLPLTGTRSTFTPGHPESADITVLGPQRKQPQVVFVLDCSSSMQQPVSLEAAPSRRFDVARLALELLMRELAVDESFRVGMVLFGHRTRWDQEDRTLVKPQVQYSRPIPPGQKPYDDVETVLPLGRFDSSIAANLFDQLDTTMPWGESPLYAALLEAIRQFPDDASAGEQFIVVVTDGLNHQFGAPASQEKRAAHVQQAVGNRPIAINVVGFDVPAEEAAEAQRVYSELTQGSQGRYTPIGESGRLLDYLRSLFPQEQFSVGSTRRPPQRADVGTTLRVRSVPAAGESVQVSAADAAMSLTLEGGEALRLLLSSDGTRLSSQPYLDGNPTFVPLVGGGQARSLTLGVHRPVRRDTVVQFEFSIQARDGNLAPRPSSAWIELTPVSPTGARGKPYTFYDRSFADGTGVPVLVWDAEDWPEDATQAEVRFWCRFDVLEPDADEPLSSLGAAPVEREGATLTVVPGKTGDDSVVVVEQYRTPPAEFPAMRIDLSDSERVVREFDREHSAVIHRFQLPPDAGETRLQITRRDRITTGAWQLTRPVLVDIAISDSLILPTLP